MDLPTVLIPKEKPSSEMPTSHIRPDWRNESRKQMGLQCSQPPTTASTHTLWWRWRCYFWHRWHLIQQDHHIKRKQEGLLPTNPTSELKEIQPTHLTVWQFPQVPPNISLQKNDSPRTNPRQYIKIATPQVPTKNICNYPQKAMLNNGNPPSTHQKQCYTMVIPQVPTKSSATVWRFPTYPKTVLSKRWMSVPPVKIPVPPIPVQNHRQ